MFSIIQAAGWPIWPLILCSILALALVIERLIQLQSHKISPPQTLEQAIEATRRGDSAKALDYTSAAEAYANRLIATEKEVWICGETRMGNRYVVGTRCPAFPDLSSPPALLPSAAERALTYMGLAGMGDLIATCTSRHSRNRKIDRKFFWHNCVSLREE